MQVAEAKAHFSSILKEVQAGSEIAITYGKKQEPIAIIVPPEDWKKKQKRVLGTLEGKMSVTFANDFKMTEEEFINL